MLTRAVALPQYVLSGAIHEFGLGSRFKQLFDEVQPNPSKCTTKPECSIHDGRCPRANRLFMTHVQVQRSNMSKACSTREEAERTVRTAMWSSGHCDYVSRTQHRPASRRL